MIKYFYHHFHFPSGETQEHPFQIRINTQWITGEKDEEGNDIFSKPTSEQVDDAFIQKVFNRMLAFPSKEIYPFLNHHLEKFLENESNVKDDFVNHTEGLIRDYIYQNRKYNMDQHPNAEMSYQWIAEQRSGNENNVDSEEDEKMKTIRYKKPKKIEGFTANQIALLANYLMQKGIIAEISKNALASLMSALTGISENTIYGRDGSGLRDLEEAGTKENLEKIKEVLLKVVQNIDNDIQNL